MKSKASKDVRLAGTEHPPGKVVRGGTCPARERPGGGLRARPKAQQTEGLTRHRHPYHEAPESYLAGLHVRAAMIWIDDLLKAAD
ncbi:hypothetical protein [Streptomyces sp. CB00455]|uniref:hypothetical protein n=1 Tax=Streptomyces sp. CB00455 TaxID=1703927 RepID=UPI000A7FFB52|nr:hypothetical protein [Streptomyces sp. CB00455]